jgi:hypothetical protein
MVEGDLSIPLFLVGTGVTLLATGITQAGWRHRLLICGLFAFGIIVLLAGLFWHWLKDYSPTTAISVITEIASNSVAWFVVIMLALFVALLRNPKISTLSGLSATSQAEVRPPADAPNRLEPIRPAEQFLVPLDAYYLHDPSARGFPHKLWIVLRNESRRDLIVSPANWETSAGDIATRPMPRHPWTPEGPGGWENNSWSWPRPERELEPIHVARGQVIQTYVGLPGPLNDTELRRRIVSKRLGTLIVPFTIDGRTTSETIRL